MTALGQPVLEAGRLIERVAAQLPENLRQHIVVIGSIATAYAFRDIAGSAIVATKDIDLLLRPAVDAVATAEAIGTELLAAGWQPQFPNGIAPGGRDTPSDKLPALRLKPPAATEYWFVELLAEPPQGQVQRKHWQRLTTPTGEFGLPSFRYMPIAIHDALTTPFGLRIAHPAAMALAHLLEHSEPDATPISGLEGTPPRFVKDVGRAIALWWLAQVQSTEAADVWQDRWDAALDSRDMDVTHSRAEAAKALEAVAPYVLEARALALKSVLAAHGTTLQAYERAHAQLGRLLRNPSAS